MYGIYNMPLLLYYITRLFYLMFNLIGGLAPQGFSPPNRHSPSDGSDSCHRNKRYEGLRPRPKFDVGSGKP